jgi:glutamate dehydrogenase (NADP+)
MSLKTAAAGLPLGGAKGGVAVDPVQLTEDQLEQISRAYVRHLAPHIGEDVDIPAPDVNTDSKIIDWMVDEYENYLGRAAPASFTGKSLGNHGSLGREEATGRGGLVALLTLLKLLNRSSMPLTVAVQGFGNVGYHFTHLAAHYRNLNIVAFTDASGGLVSKSYAEHSGEQIGFDLGGIKHRKASHRLLEQCYCQHGMCAKVPATHIDNKQLLELGVDILILAALGDVVNETNADKIKAKYIIELANGPISESAHDHLAKKGVVILPDIIANAGGVIVSHLEWRQNKFNQLWDIRTVNSRLSKMIMRATQDPFQISKDQNIPLKYGAFHLALSRLAN